MQAWRRGGRRSHADSGVGVGLVQRLVLEKRVRETVEPKAILDQQRQHLLVWVADDAVHLGAESDLE